MDERIGSRLWLTERSPAREREWCQKGDEFRRHFRRDDDRFPSSNLNAMHKFKYSERYRNHSLVKAERER